MWGYKLTHDRQTEFRYITHSSSLNIVVGRPESPMTLPEKILKQVTTAAHGQTGLCLSKTPYNLTLLTVVQD